VRIWLVREWTSPLRSMDRLHLFLSGAKIAVAQVRAFAVAVPSS